MTANPNGRNLRGWLMFVLAVLVLIGGISTAWGIQLNTIANHGTRIERLEKVNTTIRDELIRIRTILEEQEKEKP